MQPFIAQTKSLSVKKITTSWHLCMNLLCRCVCTERVLVFRSLQRVSVPFPQRLVLTSNLRQDSHQNFLYLHHNSLEELLEAKITQINLFLVTYQLYFLYQHDFKRYMTSNFFIWYVQNYICV